MPKETAIPTVQDILRGPRVVYGEAGRVGPKSLEHYGLALRQIPYELKVD